MASNLSPAWADGPFKLVQTPSSIVPDNSPENDAFTRVASHMGVVHNIFLRGLNSIYLQAPHVQPKDCTAFVGYCTCFYTGLAAHHHGEETHLFPEIEKLAGEKGLMEKNVEQHKAFHGGMDAMNDYLVGLKGKEKEFDGEKLVEIIDSFGPALMEHLADELDSLIALRKYGDKLAILENMMDEEGKTAMKSMSLTGPLPWCFLNHDITYESGRWADFPPEGPKLLLWIVKNVATWRHASWWKFASCDSSGRPQPLYATAS